MDTLWMILGCRDRLNRGRSRENPASDADESRLRQPRLGGQAQRGLAVALVRPTDARATFTFSRSSWPS
jgi:hypothetical protein